jgi:hypothetical protein
MRYRSSPAVGVLITVGAGVAVLMALWPLMVAFSEVAAFGLALVAALAVSVLVADVTQAALARRRRHGRRTRLLPR